MNNKLIATFFILIVFGVIGFFFMRNYNAGNMKMYQNKSSNQKTNPASPTSKNTVTIQNFSFSPASMTVKVGDKVTWINQDSEGHSATGDDKSFDTGILSQGQSGSTFFSKAGTYTYHCSVHTNMKATIIVQ